MYDMSVKDAAERFGYTVKGIRNLCHARGQKFAVRFVPNGKFYIDPDKFQAFIERKVDT